MQALARVRLDEERQAARLAYETRAEFEREEAERQRAKEALKEFLLGNERNKVLREEAKKKQWEEDAAFQRAWEAQLDKQEKERTSRLERLKKIQVRGARASACRSYACEDGVCLRGV